MQRLLTLSGLVLVLIGLTWPRLDNLPLGRLPGTLLLKERVSVVISLLLPWY